MRAQDPLPPDSLAARVQQIERVAASASSLDATQKEKVVRRLSAEVAAEASPLATRLAAVGALGELATPSAITGLETGTRAADAELRVAAAQALGNVRSAEAVTLLGELLSYDSDADVRLAAAKSLSSFKTPEATQLLATVLADRDPAVQLAAMRSLQSVTGRSLGTDVGKWKKYVATLPAAPSRGDAGTDSLRR